MNKLLIVSLFFLPQNPSLDSQSPKEREAAIEKMAVLGNREAIPKLAEALKQEPKSDLRIGIVAGLGRIRDREAIPVFAEVLRGDLDKDVRLQAIDSLLRLYIPVDDTGAIQGVFSRVKSVFSQPAPLVVGPEIVVDAEAKEVLATVVQKDFNAEVRTMAARALGSLKAKDQVPALIAALEDPQNREHRSVRVEIVRTLGSIRDPAAGPALARTLKTSDTKVAEEAILAVGLAGYSDARAALEDLFRNDKNRSIRGRALEALALLRDKETIPLFESLLDDRDDTYRELSAEGLSRLDYDARGWKQRFTDEKKQGVRNALAFGLASSGELDYINNLAHALDSRQSQQAEVYLYELGKFDGHLGEIYRYLRSSNPKVRAGIVRVVGNIGDPASIDHIRPLTDDESLDVVREAVAALRKLGP